MVIAIRHFTTRKFNLKTFGDRLFAYLKIGTMLLYFNADKYVWQCGHLALTYLDQTTFSTTNNMRSTRYKKKLKQQ